MAAFVLFLLPVLALTTIPAHAEAVLGHGHRQVAEHSLAVTEFTTAVNRYLELHRLLESPMAHLTRGTDLEQTERTREAHRKAIVEARIATPRGDIFTARVAADIRRELLIAMRRAQIAEADVTQVALDYLPALPNEVEYRFVDRDLVLLDTETLLVVDVLEHALPPEVAAGPAPRLNEEDLCAPEIPPPAVQGGPCQVHPELPMCWS